MREDNFERELDAALARYSAAEPREGLEQRVLANLRAQQARATRFTWKRLAAAGCAVAILAVLAIWVGGRHSSLLNAGLQPAQQEMASTSARVPAMTAGVGHASERSSQEAMVMNVQRHQKHSIDGPGGVNASPKLAQFPAPEPLTQQERLVIEFVQQDPQDAALVAEATMERLQREAEELKADNSSAE